MNKPNNRIHKINEHTVTEDQLSALALVDNASIHFGQSAEDIFLLRFFYQKRGGFYIDIGSYSPTRYSNTFLLHHLYNWRGINIDASSESIKEFNRTRKEDINICSAIGKPSNRTYYAFTSSARNTLSSKNVDRQNTKGDVSIASKQRVAVRSMSDILKSNLPKGQQIDILDIDVEGLEMEVLESNDWKLFRPRLVLLEDYEVGKGNLLGSSIYNYMIDKKYRFIGHNFDTSFYEDSTFDGKELATITREDFIKNIQHLDRVFGGHTGYKELQTEYSRVSTNLQRVRKEKQDIEGSVSWKVTSPLRYIKSLIK